MTSSTSTCSPVHNYRKSENARDYYNVPKNSQPMRQYTRYIYIYIKQWTRQDNFIQNIMTMISIENIISTRRKKTEIFQCVKKNVRIFN